MIRFINIAIVLLIIFIIFSCSNRYNQKIYNGKIIENIPFYPQLEYQCGPASLAAVINYHGLEITPEKIAEEIFSKSAKGTLTIDMVLYAKSKGLKAIQYSGKLDDLRFNIDSGYPLIVLVDYGFLFYKHHHFMVVIGYNDRGVIINSDTRERQFIRTEDFLKIWQKTNYWVLLIKRYD